MRGVTAGAAFVLVSAVRIVARRARAVEQVAQPVVLLVGIGLRRRLATGLDRNPLRAALAGIEGSFGRLLRGASLVATGIVCAHEPGRRQKLRDACGLANGYDGGRNIQSGVEVIQDLAPHQVVSLKDLLDGVGLEGIQYGAEVHVHGMRANVVPVPWRVWTHLLAGMVGIGHQRMGMVAVVTSCVHVLHPFHILDLVEADGEQAVATVDHGQQHGGNTGGIYGCLLLADQSEVAAVSKTGLHVLD